MTDVGAPARIAQLPEVLANQIAAGEVVERPAAVVKELVENSIDAGAGHVRVDIEGGGITLIRVRDDGTGIAQDDLALAVSRHATSKLRNFDDLQNVATLGFRGEALPSIAAVARVRLTSRPEAQPHAFTLVLEGSANPEVPVPSAHPRGTTVEVRDLFFNTPARRRFVRTERTEFLHIEATLKRIALASPEVRLELHAGARRVFDAPPAASAPLRRLRALLGKSFADDVVSVADAAASMRLEGWVSRGGRAHDDVQYMSVNGRGVRDPVLRHAIRAAFAEHMMAGRQAGFVLALTVPSTHVDVNVHPTKHELRFRDARGVHDFIVSAISGALGQGLALGDETHGGAPVTREAGGSAVVRTAESHAGYSGVSHGGTGGGVSGGRTGGVPRPSHPLAGGLHSPGAVPATDAPPPGRWVRQIDTAMVLTAAADSHYMIDLRLLAPALVLAALTGPTEADGRRAQPLLLPYAWRPTGTAAERLEAESHAFAAIGIELRRSGTDEWLVVSVPRVLQPIALDVLVPAIEQWLATAADTSLVKVCAQAAGEAAVTLRREAVESWLALAATYGITGPETCARLDTRLLERLFTR